MYYSLTFTINDLQRNTWDNWKLIPDTPPMIPHPEPNLNYVEIPGRTGGPLDLTGVPFNKMTYKRVTGSWNFLRDPTNQTTRKVLYEQMAKYFNGQTGKVMLEEDPDHYYVGRFSVSLPKSSIGPIQLTIAYDLLPLRYNSSNDAVDRNYGPGTGSVYNDSYNPGSSSGGGESGLTLTYNADTGNLKIDGIT